MRSAATYTRLRFGEQIYGSQHWGLNDSDLYGTYKTVE